MGLVDAMWQKRERASVVFHEEAGCCARIRDGGGEVDEERDKNRTGSWCLEGEARRQNHFSKIDSVEVGSLARLGLIYCTGPHWYVVRVERPLGRGFFAVDAGREGGRKATNLALRSTALGNLARTSSPVSTREVLGHWSIPRLPSAVSTSVYRSPISPPSSVVVGRHPG